MLSHCSRMYPPKLSDLDSDCLARKRFPARKDRHDSMHRGSRGRHSKARVQNTKGRKHTRACSPMPVEDDGPERLDCRAPPGHPAYLYYLEPRYRSESPPSAHRDRCPICSKAVRGGWLSCTRNRGQFVELRHEPVSATVRGGFLGNRHGSAIR
jgi:hypothetical protein